MSETFKDLAPAKGLCPTMTRRCVEQEGALVVDVRESDDAALSGISGVDVVFHPLSSLEATFAELPRDRLLVTMSLEDDRSIKAAYFLMYHGFTHVAFLEGGLEKWSRKGFPTRGELRTTENEGKVAASSSCCG